MDPLTGLGVGFGAGMGAMYILVRLFPALMSRRWREDVAQEVSKQRREAKHKKEEEARKALEASSPTSAGAMESLESYRAMITRFDVQRGSTISLCSRFRDLAQDIRHDKRVRHLIQIVFCDWNVSSGTIWRDPALAKFVHKVYEEEPSLPFLLDQASILPVIELIYASERGQPSEGDDRPPLDGMEEIHARFVPEARRFFESLIPEKPIADSIADACVERLEKAITKVVPAPVSGVEGAAHGGAAHGHGHLAPTPPPAPPAEHLPEPAAEQAPMPAQPKPAAKPEAIPPTTPPAPMPPSSSGVEPDMGPPGPESTPPSGGPSLLNDLGGGAALFGGASGSSDDVGGSDEANPFFGAVSEAEAPPPDYSPFGSFLPGGVAEGAAAGGEDDAKGSGA